MRSIIAAILGTVLLTAVGVLSARKIGLEKTYKPSPLWSDIGSGPHSFATLDSNCAVPTAVGSKESVAKNSAHFYFPLRRTKDGVWLVWREADLIVDGVAKELRSQSLEQLVALIPAIQNCKIAAAFSAVASGTVILDVLDMRPDAYDELEESLKILVPNLKRAERPEPGTEVAEVSAAVKILPQLIVTSPYKRVLDEFKRAQPTWALGTSDDQVYRSVSLADVWLEPVDNIKSILVVVPDESGRMPEPNSRWFTEMSRRQIPFFIRPTSKPTSLKWLNKLRAEFPTAVWGDAN